MTHGRRKAGAGPGGLWEFSGGGEDSNEDFFLCEHALAVRHEGIERGKMQGCFHVLAAQQCIFDGLLHRLASTQDILS